MKRSLRLATILSPMFIMGLLFGPIWAIAYIVCLCLLALIKVAYCSLTFNDCKSASESLKKEIIEARVDLAKKGFKFIT